MAVAFRTKAEQLWRRFDFHSPSRIDRGIELFMSIHKELTQNKIWESPKVLINTTVGPALMAELTDVVKRHQVCVCVCVLNERVVMIMCGRVWWWKQLKRPPT